MIFFTTEIFLLFLSPYSVLTSNTPMMMINILFFHFGLMEVYTVKVFTEKLCFIVRKSLAYFSDDREDDDKDFLLFTNIFTIHYLNLETEIT